LENSNQNPAYDVMGESDGRQIKATATPTDSDAAARRCEGTISRAKSSDRIVLLCENGEFIGLIRDVPSN